MHMTLQGSVLQQPIVVVVTQVSHVVLLPSLYMPDTAASDAA